MSAEVVRDEYPPCVGVCVNCLPDMSDIVIPGPGRADRRCDDPARGDFEVGNQAECAVAFTVVFDTLRLSSGFGRMRDVTSFQCLNARLLIVADHTGPRFVQFGRLLIYAADGPDFLIELLLISAVRIQPVPRFVRSHLSLSQKPSHTGRRYRLNDIPDHRLLSDILMSPAADRSVGVVENFAGDRHNVYDLFRREMGRSTRTRRISENFRNFFLILGGADFLLSLRILRTSQTRLGLLPSPAPFAHRLYVGFHLLRNLPLRRPFRMQKNNLTPLPQPFLIYGTTIHLFKDIPLPLRHGKCRLLPVFRHTSFEHFRRTACCRAFNEHLKPP